MPPPLSQKHRDNLLQKAPSGQLGTHGSGHEYSCLVIRESDSSTSSDNEYFSHTANHLKQIGRVRTANDGNKRVYIHIGDTDVEPKIGDGINIMDEHQS